MMQKTIHTLTHSDNKTADLYVCCSTVFDFCKHSLVIGAVRRMAPIRNSLVQFAELHLSHTPV